MVFEERTEKNGVKFIANITRVPEVTHSFFEWNFVPPTYFYRSTMAGSSIQEKLKSQEERDIFEITKHDSVYHSFANVSMTEIETSKRVKDAMKKLQPYAVPKLETLRHGANQSDIEKYRQYLKNLDIMGMTMPAFLSDYKNPCWKEAPGPSSYCRLLAPKKRHSPVRATPVLRCLPYFIFIGQPKCGTTGIYHRLGKHPDVTLPNNKEPFWFNRKRFFKECSSVSTYLDFFQRHTEIIERRFQENGSTNVQFHHMVTGEGSVDIMWDNHLWQDLPRNSKCTEPCLTNADYIHHLNPGTKIIVALRNPVDRVYSDYLYELKYLKYKPDTLDFHKRIIQAIYRFKGCLKHYSLRRCVYDSKLENAMSFVRPIIGIYHAFLEDWLKVFPRDQVHVIRFEDYVANTRGEMEKLFDFLSLSQLSESQWMDVLNKTQSNPRPKSSRNTGNMNNDTRTILEEFYEPYNQRLAQLLADEAYLWRD
ncbi:carbohydrate sulfotransferase 15-like [Haliotis rubra]|uniref:carbohydrate sulfotransferase 15-like n=1 Tax=Haliotis rubra TaxID=36100 RepID=UPI001EE5ED5D|nr:carbohydrate sulfotransferase 15-like [Haliotis rubra]